MFVFGISLGGILSAILPAVEPAIIAAAPASGAGGLADVGLRSTLDQVVQAVFLELFGPMIATCPWSPSGGPYDPQVRTVEVPVFESNSYRRGVDLQLTEAVQKQIQLRTPFRVVKDGGDRLRRMAVREERGN